MDTYIRNDREVTDCLDDDQPPIDGVSFDGQDSFGEVDDFELRCVETEDA